MKKILVYRNSSLGDFIVSLPAVNIIRQKNKNSKIYFCSWITNVLGHVNPDRLPISKKLIDDFIFFKKGFLGTIKLLIKLKRMNFDKIYYLNEIVDYRKLKRDKIFFDLVGIKKKYGFQRINYDYNKHNETYYLCKRVDPDGNFKITFDGVCKKTKYTNANYITISMGGRNKKKNWKIKNWKILIKKILNYFPNIKLKFVGSKKELRQSNYINKINPYRIKNHCGESIKEMFDMLEKSKLHISHDDGTMHVASIFSKRCVSIFGKYDKKGKWYTSNPNQINIYPKRNINEINPDSVFFYIKKVKKKK